MQRDELRFRMACHHAIARFDQLGVAGKIAAVKRPVGMIVQLLVTFVEAVGRSEERDRVGDVNCDRHVELPARIPHGIEARIVDLHQRT